MAVTAMANAPQKVTLTIALGMFAPPAFAPTAPSTARNNSDAKATIGTVSPGGATKTIIRGKAAPTVNDPAEASAAWTGRAVVASDIPSSS